MTITFDNIGKPVWIALMVLGFIWFWPIGLAILVYLIWSGMMGSWLNQRLWLRQCFGSGNIAFDEHRAEVLRNLQKEGEDFETFLAKLAKAKDKTEFDQFMAERK